jgi:hypothetical protein
MQRVHAHGMAARFDGGAAARPRSLEHAKLCLELGCVTPEGVERLAYALGIETVPGLRDVLVPRK